MGPRLEEDGDGTACQGGGEGIGVGSTLDHGNGKHLGPGQVEHVERRREAGVLDDDAVTEGDGLGDEAVEGVHGPVDHGEGTRRERPGAVEQAGQLRDGGIGEVARDRVVVMLAREGGADRRQQPRVGRAEAEVQPVGVGVDRHLPEALGLVGTPPCPHEGAPAAVGDHEAGVLEATPGVGHRRGADVEFPRQRAHGGEAGLGGEGAVAHQAAHGGRDAGGAAVIDGADDSGEMGLGHRKSFDCHNRRIVPYIRRTLSSRPEGPGNT